MAHSFAIPLLVRDHAPNYTIPTELCTLETCSISQAQLTYDPNLPGNVVFAALFALLLSIQILLGVYYRTWSFSIGLIGGLALELCGYIGRIQMHYNPFIASPFFMYLISITIGPTWLCASIYVCFSRIITVYCPNLSRLTPRKITIIFIVSDFISLLLQAGGGAIAVVADNVTFEYVGIHLMLAGLALQVFSLAMVLALAADFARACLRGSRHWNANHAVIRDAGCFKVFIVALLVSTVVILVRSSFRVAELSGGFHGMLWNSEIDFMVLDGAMSAIASLCLTIAHPGLTFHGRWEFAKAG